MASRKQTRAPEPEPEGDPWLDMHGIADHSGYAYETVRRYIRLNKGPRVSVSKKTGRKQARRSWVDAWLGDGAQGRAS